MSYEEIACDLLDKDHLPLSLPRFPLNEGDVIHYPGGLTDRDESDLQFQVCRWTGLDADKWPELGESQRLIWMRLALDKRNQSEAESRNLEGDNFRLQVAALDRLIEALQEFEDSEQSSDCGEMPEAVTSDHDIHISVASVQKFYRANKLPAPVRSSWIDLKQITNGKRKTERANQEAMDACFSLGSWAESEKLRLAKKVPKKAARLTDAMNIQSASPFALFCKTVVRDLLEYGHHFEIVLERLPASVEQLQKLAGNRFGDKFDANAPINFDSSWFTTINPIDASPTVFAPDEENLHRLSQCLNDWIEFDNIWNDADRVSIPNKEIRSSKSECETIREEFINYFHSIEDCYLAICAVMPESHKTQLFWNACVDGYRNFFVEPSFKQLLTSCAKSHAWLCKQENKTAGIQLPNRNYARSLHEALERVVSSFVNDVWLYGFDSTATSQFSGGESVYSVRPTEIATFNIERLKNAVKGNELYRLGFAVGWDDEGFERRKLEKDEGVEAYEVIREAQWELDSEREFLNIPLVGNVVDSDSKKPKKKANGPKMTVHKRMILEVADNPDAAYLTASKWAEMLHCAPSTVKGTKAWKMMDKMRAQRDSQKLADRNR